MKLLENFSNLVVKFEKFLVFLEFLTEVFEFHCDFDFCLSSHGHLKRMLFVTIAETLISYWTFRIRISDSIFLHFLVKFFYFFIGVLELTTNMSVSIFCIVVYS